MSEKINLNNRISRNKDLDASNKLFQESLDARIKKREEKFGDLKSYRSREKQVTTPKDKSLEDLAVRYQTEIFMMGDKSKSKTKRETDLEKKLQSVLNKLSGTNVMGGQGRQRILSVIKQRAMNNYRDAMGISSSSKKKEVEVPKSKPTARGASLFREIGSAVKDLFKKKKKGINRGGAILKNNVEKMMYGGMANKKKHMYAAGGSVSDNAGLRALKKVSPKAYANIKKGN